jgi:hypothetical protein
MSIELFTLCPFTEWGKNGAHGKKWERVENLKTTKFKGENPLKGIMTDALPYDGNEIWALTEAAQKLVMLYESRRSCYFTHCIWFEVFYPPKHT